MRFLILSDIHGNRHGLEAVLQAAAGRYDQLLCLGDVVGYGASPNECCEILRGLDARCLLGNHDAAALGRLSTEWFNAVASLAIEWTAAALEEPNRSWLERLQPQGEWNEFDFQAVHGSLRKPLEEYIVTKGEAQPNLKQMGAPLCFFGHTHIATVYEEMNVPGRKYSLEETPLPHGGRIELEEEYQYLVNPGSCGQPRDRNPQARYALFDTKTCVIEVLAVDYDIEAAREAILQAGLPSILGDRLRCGK